MNSRKRTYWLSMLIVGAFVAAYLFYSDDWEERHKPGYKSTDSFGVVAGVFVFYTLLSTGVLGGIGYVVLKRYLDKETK